MENSIETELDVKPLQDEELREGVLKGNLSDILGEDFGKDDTKDEKQSQESTQETDKENTENSGSKKTNKEIFAEVKAMCFTLNFIICTGCGMIGNIFGKNINTANINASDAELNRLAKVAQPVYEKYSTKMSLEWLLIVTILSIYGFRIAGEFMQEPEMAAKATNETAKAFRDKDALWVGNPDYFQTGKKMGQLKKKK